MIDDVWEFQVKSEQLSLYDPAAPSDKPELYLKLVKEEYKELIAAVESGVEKDILNEAMDLIWVTIGLCNVKGHRLDAAWKVLARSNMAKLQKDPTTGKLLRNSEGKIMKPSNWEKPDYAPFVSHINNKGGLR